jgi:ketosteroid isomerase-like protein
MSQRNEETVLAMTEAYNSASLSDLDAWLVEFFDPEIEWHDVPTLPGAGVYHGYDAFRRACERYLEAWAETSTKIEEIRSVGDRVVARVRYGGIGQGSGARVVGAMSGPARGAVFEFRDGRIVRARQFVSHAEALEAVGLQR